ncbi:hypothetical protein B0H13DRAFT_2312550 [Mycena leptocephala]|nr:hypothetical protein B0H13DRAFT_2312550 [Mycena leptocephala]
MGVRRVARSPRRVSRTLGLDCRSRGPLGRRTLPKGVQLAWGPIGKSHTKMRGKEVRDSGRTRPLRPNLTTTNWNPQLATPSRSKECAYIHSLVPFSAYFYIQNTFNIATKTQREKLEATYPIGGCTLFPDKRVYHDEKSNFYFELMVNRIAVWASSMAKGETDELTPPMSSRFFDADQRVKNIPTSGTGIEGAPPPPLFLLLLPLLPPFPLPLPLPAHLFPNLFSPVF